MDYEKSLKTIKTAILKKEQLEKNVISYDDVPTVKPEHTDKPSRCTCKDSHQRFKKLYDSKHEAEHKAKYSNSTNTISVYLCPSTTGWHLTHT